MKGTIEVKNLKCIATPILNVQPGEPNINIAFYVSDELQNVALRVFIPENSTNSRSALAQYEELFCQLYLYTQCLVLASTDVIKAAYAKTFAEWIHQHVAELPFQFLVTARIQHQQNPVVSYLDWARSLGYAELTDTIASYVNAVTPEQVHYVQLTYALAKLHQLTLYERKFVDNKLTLPENAPESLKDKLAQVYQKLDDLHEEIGPDLKLFEGVAHSSIARLTQLQEKVATFLKDAQAVIVAIKQFDRQQLAKKVAQLWAETVDLYQTCCSLDNFVNQYTQSVDLRNLMEQVRTIQFEFNHHAVIDKKAIKLNTFKTAQLQQYLEKLTKIKAGFLEKNAALTGELKKQQQTLLELWDGSNLPATATASSENTVALFLACQKSGEIFKKQYPDLMVRMQTLTWCFNGKKTLSLPTDFYGIKNVADFNSYRLRFYIQELQQMNAALKDANTKCQLQINELNKARAGLKTAWMLTQEKIAQWGKLDPHYQNNKRLFDQFNKLHTKLTKQEWQRLAVAELYVHQSPPFPKLKEIQDNIKEVTSFNKQLDGVDKLEEEKKFSLIDRLMAMWKSCFTRNKSRGSLSVEEQQNHANVVELTEVKTASYVDVATQLQSSNSNRASVTSSIDDNTRRSLTFHPSYAQENSPPIARGKEEVFTGCKMIDYYLNCFKNLFFGSTKSATTQCINEQENDRIKVSSPQT